MLVILSWVHYFTEKTIDPVSGNFQIAAISPQTIIHNPDRIHNALTWIWGRDPHAVRAVNYILERITTPAHQLTPQSSRIVQDIRHVVNFGLTYSQHIHLVDTSLLKLVYNILGFEEDIVSLLWFERPQTYLILLQNTTEKRPNGWFFGSFAVVRIWRGQILSLDIQDSYLPLYHAPHVVLDGPRWLESFLPHSDIHFVSANKIGFTYPDGGHIKQLYEKAFIGQRVRGVVFLRTDMFVELLPSFQYQQRERQFVNAATDMIRGTDGFGKKEIYQRDLSLFLQEQAPRIVAAFLSQGKELIQQRYINVYLDNISGSFHTFLRTNRLTTRYEADTLYARDSNVSFNKIDEFVDKTIRVRHNDQLIYQGSEDIIHDMDRGPGTYEMHITYHLYVPETYKSFIRSLEEEYEVTLTERELHILWLTPQRDNRGIVYLPPGSRIYDVRNDEWHLYDQSVFKTPFSHAVSYKLYLPDNDLSSTIVLQRELE